MLEREREPLIGPREHPLDHARDRTLEGVAAQRELAPELRVARRVRPELDDQQAGRGGRAPCRLGRKLLDIASLCVPPAR